MCDESRRVPFDRGGKLSSGTAAIAFIKNALAAADTIESCGSAHFNGFSAEPLFVDGDEGSYPLKTRCD